MRAKPDPGVRLVFVGMVLAASTANASQPHLAKTLTAATILARVEHHYHHATALTAMVRTIDTTATRSHTSDGRLHVAKHGVFRWTYKAKVAHQVVDQTTVIYDGTWTWTIDHVARQVAQASVGDSPYGFAVAFFSPTSLTAQFTVAIDKSRRFAAPQAHVLALTPKQPSRYTSLVLVVDSQDGHVRESIVLEANGTAHRFRFFAPDLVTPLSPQLFVVQPASVLHYTLAQPPTAPTTSPKP